MIILKRAIPLFLAAFVIVTLSLLSRNVPPVYAAACSFPASGNGTITTSCNITANSIMGVDEADNNESSTSNTAVLTIDSGADLTITSGIVGTPSLKAWWDLDETSVTTGLKAWWDLDETSGARYDSHLSNNLTDNNSTGFTTGILGNAADFESTSSMFLEIPDNANLSTGDIDFTISGWMKLESTGAHRMLATRSDSASDSEYLLYYHWTGSYGTFCFTIYNSSGTQSGAKCYNGGSEPVTGTWYHLVAVHDSVNNTTQLYVNGNSTAATNTTDVPTDTSASFRIGAYQSTEQSFMDGLIDEVSFWKKALSSDEATWLYNSGAGRSYSSFGTRYDSHLSNNLTDNNSTGFTTGILNNAADFENTSSMFFEIADNADLSTGDIDFSVSAWIKLESIGAHRMVATKHNSASVREYILFYHSAETFCLVIYNSSGTGSGTRCYNGGSTPVVGTWYHIVGVHDSVNDTVQLYVNGNSTTAANTTDVPADTDANFRIGAYQNTETAFMDGEIDEVGFWKKALSSDEVSWLYNGGTGRTYSDRADIGTTTLVMGSLALTNGSIILGSDTQIRFKQPIWVSDADADGWATDFTYFLATDSGLRRKSLLKSGDTVDCDDTTNSSTNSCGNTYYQDLDGDTYGNPDETEVGESPPEGYVEDNTDCYDADPGTTNAELAYPGSATCSGTDRGDTSYDYNCSSSETKCGTIHDKNCTPTTCSAPTYSCGGMAPDKYCNPRTRCLYNTAASFACGATGCTGTLSSQGRTSCETDGDTCTYGYGGGEDGFAGVDTSAQTCQ